MPSRHLGNVRDSLAREALVRVARGLRGLVTLPDVVIVIVMVCPLNQVIKNVEQQTGMQTCYL